MLEALLKGTADPAEIAAFAQSRAKKKIPQIMAALEENLMSDHHRTMVRFSIEHMRFLEEQIIALDEEIRRKIAAAGYVKQWELLRSLPAVKDSAATILAEMGPDPAQFPSEKSLGSWSAMCPGNNRSAGRSKTSHTKKGNPWLRAALCESAWAISRMKEGHLRDKFWRIAAKGDPKSSRPIAIVAIGHDLLKLAYFVLQRGTPYEEQRGKPMTEQQKQRLIQHHIRRLGKLGVALRPSPAPNTTCRRTKRAQATDAT